MIGRIAGCHVIIPRYPFAFLHDSSRNILFIIVGEVVHIRAGIQAVGNAVSEDSDNIGHNLAAVVRVGSAVAHINPTFEVVLFVILNIYSRFLTPRVLQCGDIIRLGNRELSQRARFWESR